MIAALAQIDVTLGGAVAICLERSFDWVVAAPWMMPRWGRICAAENSGASVLVVRPELPGHLEMKVRDVDPSRDAVD